MFVRRQILVVSCILLTILSACTPAGTTLVASAAAVRTDLANMEEEVRKGINAVRRKHGLSPLKANAAVAGIAREHSRRMAKENFFAHEDPDGRSMVDRLTAAGIPYRVAAENLLTTTNMPDPVKAAIEGWMKSRGHRANILRKDVTETGVGIWQEGKTFYFTQVFLRPPAKK